MLASVQERISLPTAPLIAQDTPVVSPVTAPSVQSTPAGRLSENDTSVAAPAPLFVTVTSQPMSSPALTGPTGLASLTMSISAQSTSIEPVSLLLPPWAAASLEAPTVTAFGIVPQSPLSVGAVRVIVRVAPLASVPKSHDRTSGFGAVSIEQDA